MNLTLLFTILGSRFSTSWGWKTVMRASVLTALLLSFCPTISVTSSGLSSKWLMSDWHSPRMALATDTYYFSMSETTANYRIRTVNCEQQLKTFYLWWSRVLRAGTNPTPAADCVGKPLVVPHLRETQRPLATHTHGQSPAAWVWLLNINNLEERRHTRQTSCYSSVCRVPFETVAFLAVFLSIK